jgi:sugar lactone lactonase YvrE
LQDFLGSNINGGMRKADDNGFISVVTQGGVSELKWISREAEDIELNASGGLFRIAPEGEVTRLAHGRHLHRPNGIGFAPDGRLVVATFAGDEVMLLSRQGEVMGRRKLGAGRLNGLVVRKDGTALVSS